VQTTPVGNGNPNIDRPGQDGTQGFDTVLATQRTQHNDNADGRGGRPPGTQVAQIAIPLTVSPFFPGSPANQDWVREYSRHFMNGINGLINHITPSTPSKPGAPSPSSRPDAANPTEASSAKQWPPCRTISGKIVPVGTLAYRPLDIPPPGQTEHGIAGPHYNMYRANQNPNNGQCFWQPVGAIPAFDLPSDAIPIEPFAP
jgi:hypothetical protein